MTPIDASLPFAMAAIALWAWLVRDTRWMTAILAAIPLLVVVEAAIPAERLRLLAIGVVTAAAFGAAVFAATQVNAERRTQNAELRSGPFLRSAFCVQRSAFLFFGLSATFLLRWLPLATVDWKKELVVLAGVALFLATTRSRTPLSLAVILLVALVTPLHPGRMVFYPALVGLAQVLMPWPLAGAVVFFGAAAIARYSLAALYVLAAAAFLVPFAARRSPLATRVILVFAGVLLALWPWSGAVSRLLPLPVAGLAVAAVVALALSGRLATIAGTLLVLLVPFVNRVDGVPKVIGVALRSSQSLDVPVPPKTAVVVMRISGANMARMRPGRVIGQIEAVDTRGRESTRVLRIGDVADFGFMRREQFFRSNNVPPRNHGGELREYGNASFLYGAGRIPIRMATAGAGWLRVVAANDLPHDARLQVETVEYRAE